MDKIHETIDRVERIIDGSDIVSVWKSDCGTYYQGMVKNGRKIINVAEFTLEELLETITKQVKIE